MYHAEAQTSEINPLVLPDIIVQIPAHAKVHCLPVQTLPPALLKRLGEQTSNNSSLKKKATSLRQTVAYISPVQASSAALSGHLAAHQESNHTGGVGKRKTSEIQNKYTGLQEKNRKPIKNEGVRKITLSRLSIKTSNSTAFAYLKNLDQPHLGCKPINCVTEYSVNNRNSITTFKDDALVIYNGKAYLFIFRKDTLVTAENKSQDAVSKLSSQKKSSHFQTVPLLPKKSTPEESTEEKSKSELSDDLEKIGKEATTASPNPRRILETDHHLRRRFGISSEVEVCLTRIPTDCEVGDQENATADPQEELKLNLHGETPDEEVPAEMQIKSKRSGSKNVNPESVKRLKTEPAIQKSSEEQLYPNDIIQSSKCQSSDSSYVSELGHDLLETDFPETEGIAEVGDTPEMAVRDNISVSYNLPLPNVGMGIDKGAIGLDFDETIRDEKIERIKELLKEKEAALEAIRRKNFLS